MSKKADVIFYFLKACLRGFKGFDFGSRVSIYYLDDLRQIFNVPESW